MLGDDAQPAESDGSRDRATSGPRHAAPRKSLLTKLHVPAGKAVALAAMPTAVLMGMGFTPHLAQADEMPKNPFKAGPCVTQPDTPTPSPTASGTSDGKTTDKPTGKAPDPATSPTPTTSPTPSTGADAPTTPATSPPATQKPDAKTAPTTPAAPPATPSATPSPKKTVNPLDPLGLGDVLKTLLGGDTSSPAPTTPPTTKAPDPAPTTAQPTPSASPSATAKGPDSSDPVSTVGKTVKKTLDGTTDALSKAAKSAKDTADAAATTAAPKAGTGVTTGPQSYPCPSYDAKALAAADVEQGIPLLPDTPWVLKTTKLSLHGLAYHGIVQVRTYSGAVKDVLKFTVSGIDIDNLHQIVDGPQGTKTNVEAAKGSTSSFTGGQVTLYTESLSGNLLGLIPITFTPKAPPPLTLPELFFTNATVIQAAQFGGTLHVPGMHIYGSAS